jgi:hypothetical protein
MSDIEKRKLLAFDWLSSVADSPGGWGTNYLNVLRLTWLSGLQLLEYVETIPDFKQWVRDHAQIRATDSEPPAASE